MGLVECVRENLIAATRACRASQWTVRTLPWCRCCFADYRRDRPSSLGMHVESRCKILKMCGPRDSLKLRWQSGAGDLLCFWSVCLGVASVWNGRRPAVSGFNHHMLSDWAKEVQSLGIYLDDLCLATRERSS